MFRSHDTIRRSKQCITTRREHRKLFIVSIDLEDDIRALRFTDPVSLHFLCRLRPVHELKIIQKLFGIIRDLQDPLTHRLANDRIAAALALSINDLFVGEDRLQFRTPIDRDLIHIGKPRIVQLNEDPLRPFIIARIACRDFPIPIVAEP